MTTYKNQAGIIYSVRDADGGPEVMFYDTCEKYNTGWQISDRLKALCAEADADTAEKMQNVLDGYAKKLGWETCENPTDAAEEAAVTEPTESVAPASGDEQYPDWLPSAAKELADLMRNEHGIDPRKATVADFRKFYGNSYTGRGGPLFPGFACTPKGVDLSFDSFGKNKQVSFTWLNFVTYMRSVLSAPEPSAAPEVQTAERTEPVAENAAIAAPETAPAAFDYSGLDEPTAEIMHNADRIMQTARRNYIFDTARGVKMAHDALSSHYGGTFGKWCESYGMSRVTANKLLQVVNLIYNSTSEEQAVLEQAPTTLLYAAAKPNAPAEAVEAVKTGDVTTMPEYKAKLEEIEALRNQNESLLHSYESEKGKAASAESRAQSAEREKSEIEKERDGARQALQASKMRADKWQAEAEAAKQAPIVPATVVDQDEVERRAQELAAQMVAAQQEDSDAAHNAYDAVILACRTFTNTWQTVQPLLPQIPAGQRTSAREMLLQKLNEIKEDAIQCL